MDCPRCATALVRATIAGTEADRCPGCAGVWLDPAEGEAVTRPGVPREVLAAAIEDVRRALDLEAPVACPKCAQPMTREAYERSKVVIDRCRCGVWTDEGELEKIGAYRERRLAEMRDRFGKIDGARLERIYARAYFDVERRR